MLLASVVTLFCVNAEIVCAQPNSDSAVRGLKTESEQVSKLISGLEADAKAGTLNVDKLKAKRTINMNFHFIHVIQGGTQGQCESCKQSAVWTSVRDAYAGFEKRMQALERTYLKCTWGFMMPNGNVTSPDGDWSFAEYEALRKKAKQQQMKCWSANTP